MNMAEPISNLMREMNSQQYEYAWYIDLTEAYNNVVQPLLVDELNRRREVWNMKANRLKF